MTIARPIATSFNGGELSPRMGGRVDTAIYAVAVETCENFVPTVEGAAVKRPGFEYIRPAAATASRLTNFRFNLTQDYALEWSDGKLRFYTNGVRIETAPNVPYEVSVPYGAAEAAAVSFEQSFDRLYLAHSGHPPAALTRTGATTFSYAPLTFKNGPFADGNIDETMTVTANGVTGTITLTASSPIFLAGHVGALFRIEARDFSDVPAWEVGIDGIAIGNRRRSEGKVYQAETAGRTGTIQPIHTSGSEWDGSSTGKDVNDNGPYGVRWAYLHDRFGIVRITGIGGGGTTATATVERRLPDSVTTVASWRWAHALFSAAAGWPNVVKIWQGRLVFIKAFDLVASVAGDFLNHATVTSSGLIAADLAFRRTLSSQDPVLWAVGDRQLIVGTASREIAVGPTNQAAAVAGDNISADPQSFYGSELVMPMQIGTSTIFVQRGGRKVRQAQYDFSQDRYVAANMTVWARHITKGGVVQLAFQREPEELLFAVRGDGQLAVHPHSPEQEVKGFARIVHSNGLARILSATCVVGADGKTDELWALVQRGAAKSVERMAAWRDDGDPIEDSFFVDSGVTQMVAGGQTHFTGLTHLANMDVAVLADGGVVPGVQVAADGSFDLPATAVPSEPYRLTVGLPYTATLVTLRPELGGGGNTSQGKRQRLVRIVLRLLETVGIKIGARGGKLDNLIDRSAASDMDQPIPLFSGDSERAVSGGYDRTGQMEIVSDDPLPACIVAALPKIVVEDR
ncbi:MAG: hypothetical protein QHC65_04230 [Sphingomonas sp.]|nr:hypothetical protein [Sphingomonas sp.]